jgi:hypothetical protein
MEELLTRANDDAIIQCLATRRKEPVSMDEANVPQRGQRIVQHPILGPQTDRVTVTFSIDGKPVEAHDGDTVAAALLAAGIRVFRTMPRTGEARGGYCFVGRCTDCLLIIDGNHNRIACQTLVREGMRVERQVGLGVWAAEVRR